jgi:hypothetical protein
MVAVDDDADLTIHNHSSAVLTAVHVAHVDDHRWGPNLLPQALYPGEDLVIHDVECGRYDVLVVDERGVDCELHDFWLCFEDGGWEVTNATLAECAFRW